MSAQVGRRSGDERALVHRERLTLELGPRDAAKRWLRDLDLDAAGAFARVWALATARGYEREAAEARTPYFEERP